MNYSFHAPVQRMSNKGKRLQLEHWIAKRILTSMLKTEYAENIAEPKIKTQKKNFITPLNFITIH